MKSTKQRHASGGSAAATPLPAWDTAAELGRQQVAVATESANALFRGFNTMCKIQEQAVRQASSRHAAAADKLRKPCEPGELLQLQSELVRFDVEGAVTYWQQLAAATLETQTEMMGCASHLLDSDAVLEGVAAVAAMQSAVPGLDRFFFAPKGAH